MAQPVSDRDPEQVARERAAAEVADQLITSAVAPPKQLLALAAEEVQRRAQFVLLAEQRLVYESVLSEVRPRVQRMFKYFNSFVEAERLRSFLPRHDHLAVDDHRGRPHGDRDQGADDTKQGAADEGRDDRHHRVEV